MPEQDQGGKELDQEAGRFRSETSPQAEKRETLTANRGGGLTASYDRRFFRTKI